MKPTSALFPVKLSIVVTFVWLSSLATSALADDACKIFNDVGDKYALGQLLMETDAQMLIATKGMTTKQHDDCFSNSDDCFFTYKDGIEYIISRYYKADADPSIWPPRLDGDFVEVARARTNYTGPLIAGVKWGDTVDAVQQKLKILPKDFPAWIFSKASPATGPTALTTGPCIRSSNGAVWSYTLVFDGEDKLEFIEAMIDGYASST